MKALYLSVTPTTATSAGRTSVPGSSVNNEKNKIKSNSREEDADAGTDSPPPLLLFTTPLRSRASRHCLCAASGSLPPPSRRDRWPACRGPLWLPRLVSCLNYRHQPIFVAASKALTLTSRPRHALPGCRRRPALPPQSRLRATSTWPLLPLSCRGRPVAFSTVSRSCWSLLLSLLHVTTDAIPTTDAAVLRSPS